MVLQVRAWANAGGVAQQGPAWGGPLPAGAAGQISSAISQLTAGHIFGAVGGIGGLQNLNGWRIDRQNAPANFVNISIQRNGVAAPSTVASVFVPTAFNVAPPPGGANAVHQARIGELQRKTRNGLDQSFASYGAAAAGGSQITRFEVCGSFSAG